MTLRCLDELVFSQQASRQIIADVRGLLGPAPLPQGVDLVGEPKDRRLEGGGMGTVEGEVLTWRDLLKRFIARAEHPLRQRLLGKLPSDRLLNLLTKRHRRLSSFDRDDSRRERPGA